MFESASHFRREDTWRKVLQYVWSIRILLLVSGVLLLFLPVMRFDFILMDDPFYVANNAQVAKGLTRDTISWAFTEVTFFYHPLTLLSFLIDAQLHGINPGAFH